MSKLVYSLQIIGKNKKLTGINVEKIIDELRDQFDAACRAFDEYGNFSATIDPNEHGYVDLKEFSEKFPNYIFELTYVDNLMNIYRTIYNNGEIKFINGKVIFEDEE